jgi:hypothetical protein
LRLVEPLLLLSMLDLAKRGEREGLLTRDP